MVTLVCLEVDWIQLMETDEGERSTLLAAAAVCAAHVTCSRQVQKRCELYILKLFSYLCGKSWLFICHTLQDNHIQHWRRVLSIRLPA